MSIRKGITTWVLQVGRVTIAYRINMKFGEAMRTFHLIRGTRMAVACGPILAEW